MQMPRLELIHGLPVQNPQSLEFGASDLVWSRLEGLRDKMDRVAKIPFARVDDFVRGESNNKDCPTRFHVEARRRRYAVDGILENIMYWCSFGPDDHRKGGLVRPSRTTYVPKNKPSGRPYAKRGCRCHFIAKRLSADPSVVLIVYNDRRHVDKNGSPCHGPQDKKSAGSRAMIENSASKITDSIQHGGEPEATGSSAAPSLLETGKAFAMKGMQVLEKTGKETMDLLISETGIQVEKKSDGGPEQLEELEELSNHYALLYNRRKAKLSCEQKSIYDGKLKEVQHLFDLGAELVGLITDLEKGKRIEAVNDEFKRLHDSSLSKAAELAAGFASALAELSPNDIIQRTCGMLDALHSEGVHRLSEMCCFAVTQILMLGKSITSNTNKGEDEEIEEKIKLDWPEDSVEKAKIIRSNAQSMTRMIEGVSKSFISGISEVAEAYLAAIKGVTAGSQDIRPQKSVQGKASAFTENLRADHSTAVAKMQDGLQFLTYLVLSSSVPAAR